MKSFYTIFIAFFILLSGLNAKNNTQGNNFWFCFLENTTTYHKNINVYVYITSNQAASGTLSIPFYNWSVNFNVEANSTTLIAIPFDYAVVNGSESITRNAIHIESDNDVSVYAINFIDHSTDACLIFPEQLLLDYYYVISYKTSLVTDQYGKYLSSEFAIVATEDNTIISITPSVKTLMDKPANQAFTVLLNKGEVYQVQSNEDLTGTFVKSINNKKFALFTGKICANVFVETFAGFCDHLYEQMPPNSFFDTSYLAVPLETRLKGDVYRIYSFKENSSITINGSQVRTLNKNEWLDSLIKEPCVISSNNPIIVTQYSASSQVDNVANSDPFMIILSPITRTIDNITFHAAQFGSIRDIYLNISTYTDAVPFFLLDGTDISNKFVAYPNNPEYSYAKIKINEGAHTLINSTTLGFNAYIYGFGNADSYGYSAGMNIETEITYEQCNAGGLRAFIDNGYKLELYQNNPNPATDYTEIITSLIEKGNYKLSISNSLGQTINTIVDANLKPGIYKFHINTTDMYSGIYYYTLKTSTKIITKSMLIVK